MRTYTGNFPAPVLDALYQEHGDWIVIAGITGENPESMRSRWRRAYGPGVIASAAQRSAGGQIVSGTVRPSLSDALAEEYAAYNQQARESSLSDQDVDELLTIVRLHNKQMERIDPVITHRDIVIKSQQPVAILLAGCFQIGGRWTMHEFISDKLTEMFAHPQARIGLFGDEIENFKSGSFAGERSVFDQSLTPPLQRALWENWLGKIKDRVLWGTSSQHGTMWNEKVGHNPIKDKYLEYGIPFFDGMFYVRLKVGKITYQIAGAHEFPGSSQYNKLHPHKRALWQRYPNADVVIQADKHQYAAAEEDYGGNEHLAGNRQSPYVWLVQIGTAKSGPDPYTIRGWERGISEWPWLVLWPDQHKIKVTRDYEDVLMWTGEAV